MYIIYMYICISDAIYVQMMDDDEEEEEEEEEDGKEHIHGTNTPSEDQQGRTKWLIKVIFCLQITFVFSNRSNQSLHNHHVPQGDFHRSSVATCSEPYMAGPTKQLMSMI